MKTQIEKLENEIAVRRRHRSRLCNAVVGRCTDRERMMQKIDDLSFLIEEMKGYIFQLRNEKKLLTA